MPGSSRSSACGPTTSEAHCLKSRQGGLRRYTEWIARDGSKHLVSWNSINRRDEAGRLQEIIGFGMELTGRRRLEAEMAAGQARLRAVFDNGVVGIRPCCPTGLGLNYGGSSRLEIESRKQWITAGWARKAIRCIRHAHLGHSRASMPNTIWSK